MVYELNVIMYYTQIKRNFFYYFYIRLLKVQRCLILKRSVQTICKTLLYPTPWKKHGKGGFPHYPDVLEGKEEVTEICQKKLQLHQAREFFHPSCLIRASITSGVGLQKLCRAQQLQPCPSINHVIRVLVKVSAHHRMGILLRKLNYVEGFGAKVNCLTW